MILLWVLSILLGLFGLLCIIGNASLFVVGYYHILILKKKPPPGSMIPLVGGLSVSLAILFLPYPVSMNRALLAAIAFFSDLSIIMLMWLPFYLLLGLHKNNHAPDEPASED